MLRAFLLLSLLTGCTDSLSTVTQSLADPCWGEGPAYNLPAGTLEDFAPHLWQTCEHHQFRGADNEATRIDGLSTEGIEPGAERYIYNWSVSGLDSGGVVFLPADNVLTPNNEPCLISFLSGAAVRLGEDLKWRFKYGCHSWMYRLKHQAWNIYPTCIVTVHAGTYHDFNPACESTYATGGLAGGSLAFKDYTAIAIYTPTGNVKITGLGSITGGNDDPADVGQMKYLYNEGPGDLELAIEPGSRPASGFRFPDDESITLRPKEEAVVFSSASDLNTDRRWRLFALGQGNTRDRMKILKLLEAVELKVGAVRLDAITPAVMPATVINDWDPVDAATGTSFRDVARVRTQGSVGTVLCGMKPGKPNQIVRVTNYAAAYLLRNQCGTAPGDQQLILTTAERIIPHRGSFEMLYEGSWLVMD